MTYPDTGYASAVFITLNVNQTGVATTWYIFPENAKTFITVTFANEEPFLKLDPGTGRLMLNCPMHSFKDDFEPNGIVDTNEKTFRSDVHKNMEKIVLVTNVSINVGGGTTQLPGHPFPHEDPTDKKNEVR